MVACCRKQEDTGTVNEKKKKQNEKTESRERATDNLAENRGQLRSRLTETNG